MKKNLKEEIQVLINNYKLGDYNLVLKKASLLVIEYPKNDFLWNFI